VLENNINVLGSHLITYNCFTKKTYFSFILHTKTYFAIILIRHIFLNLFKKITNFLKLQYKKYLCNNHTKNVFGSVVAGAFQITFHVKMHANDVFLFFKNYF
jgi:hypothetical protein